jgi:tRNA-dihydrouridine synthase
VSSGVQKLKVPVTAKIRVFDDIAKSVEYAKMIESTGISVNMALICFLRKNNFQ